MSPLDSCCVKDTMPPYRRFACKVFHSSKFLVSSVHVQKSKVCQKHLHDFAGESTSWHQVLTGAGAGILKTFREQIFRRDFYSIPDSLCWPTPHSAPEEVHSTTSFGDSHPETTTFPLSSAEPEHYICKLGEWFTLFPPCTMCPVSGILGSQAFLPGEWQRRTPGALRLPTTKQPWHPADRPDLWLLFCSLLLESLAAGYMQNTDS